jgi:hypothetical protein
MDEAVMAQFKELSFLSLSRGTEENHKIPLKIVSALARI